MYENLKELKTYYIKIEKILKPQNGALEIEVK